MTSVLASWKDIAQYVGKGVCTIQRWELELDLPVRTRQAGKSVVLAVPAEIDCLGAVAANSTQAYPSERTELLRSVNVPRTGDFGLSVLHPIISGVGEDDYGLERDRRE